MFNSYEKAISRKNTVLRIEKFLSLLLSTEECDNVTTSNYPISALLSVKCGPFKKVKNKGKFKTFSSESGRGRKNNAMISCI